MDHLETEQGIESETILVVDDEEDILQCIREVLESHGYKAVTTTSPKQALDFLKTYFNESSGSGTLCAVISDFNMPQMDGMSFFKSICQLGYSHLPFILMSGRIQASDLQTFAKQGVDGLLCKPFTSDAMTFEIEEARIRKCRKVIHAADI